MPLTTARKATLKPDAIISTADKEGDEAIEEREEVSVALDVDTVGGCSEVTRDLALLI
jgi:hypothetical protein